MEDWAGRIAASAVRRAGRPRLPREGEILIGGPEHVRDLGPGGLDLVGILDADAASRRPGLASTERALAIWMEAVGWARPGGRAIVQSSQAGDAAVQALVRGNPARFHDRELRRRRDAGFPVGAPVFRVAGDETVAERVAELDPITQLVSAVGDRTVCLVALEPAAVARFGDAMRDLAAAGVVDRVEAEPHL